MLKILRGGGLFQKLKTFGKVALNEKSVQRIQPIARFFFIFNKFFNT